MPLELSLTERIDKKWKMLFSLKVYPFTVECGARKSTSVN